MPDIGVSGMPAPVPKTASQFPGDLVALIQVKPRDMVDYRRSASGYARPLAPTEEQDGTADPATDNQHQ